MRNRIIVVGHEHDRNGFTCLHEGLKQRLGTQGDENVRFMRTMAAASRGQRRIIQDPTACDRRSVPSFNEPDFAQFVEEGFGCGPHDRVASTRSEYADTFFRLLRASATGHAAAPPTRPRNCRRLMLASEGDGGHDSGATVAEASRARTLVLVCSRMAHIRGPSAKPLIGLRVPSVIRQSNGPDFFAICSCKSGDFPTGSLLNL